MTAKPELVEEARALAPWHLAVDVTPDLNTRELADGPYPDSFGRVRIIDVADRFKATLSKLFPGGLASRSVLDCGCNCGGYLFWARDLGAGTCLGVDVREHWIRQAVFLQEHRDDGHDMRFRALDLYDLPSLQLEPFDVTFFNGIFYHLPDPISALKIASGLTRDVMVLQTSTTVDVPDGYMRVSEESRTRPVSGVHGLNWFPAGPAVIARILEWAGFEHVRSSWWERTPDQVKGHGRLEMVAAKSEEALAAFDAADDSLPPVERLVERHVPPGATVAVLGAEPDAAGRTVTRLPEPAGGSADDLLDALRELRERGTGFFVIPEDQRPRLGDYPGFRKRLREWAVPIPLTGSGAAELYSLAGWT